LAILGTSAVGGGRVMAGRAPAAGRREEKLAPSIDIIWSGCKSLTTLCSLPEVKVATQQHKGYPRGFIAGHHEK